MWDKSRSMETSLFDDFHPVVSAGDFTRDRSTKCWSIQESLIALVLFSLGVYSMVSFKYKFVWPYGPLAGKLSFEQMPLA